TYHHSLVVGSLSEAGAEAVGGNPLLARVSAYYHDIGKIDKAEYYVENQSSARSRHEKLSPTMSCLIIEAHVREGAEIARREKLPKAILNGILEHHGTTLMTFFFHKAKQADPGVEERQLDESPITFEGLAKIRESFVPILTALFHARVHYPGAPLAEEQRRRSAEEGGRPRRGRAQDERRASGESSRLKIDHS